MSVPQFGGWDQKTAGGPNTDYSMVFSRARANRKQHKSDLPRRSLGNEPELYAKQQVAKEPDVKQPQEDSIKVRLNPMHSSKLCV